MAGARRRRRSASPTPTRARRHRPGVGGARPRGSARSRGGRAPGTGRHPRPRAPGDRAVAEEPDPFRTCFERDRDRILHATAFRRLAGKTQVFVFPDDHQRTRLTHALEVAQVATAIARALGLNVALTEAIALGPRLRPRPRRPRQRGRPLALRRRRATTTPSGAPTSCWRRSTCAPRRSTASATTRGPPGAGHARGRGGGLGRPHRLRVPRLRGRRRTPASSPRPCCPPWCASGAATPRSRQLDTFIAAVVDAIGRAPVAVGMSRPTRRGPGRVPARSTTSASTCGRRRWPRPTPVDRACCGPWSSTTPTAPTLLADGAADGRARRPGSAEALRAAVTYVGGMTDRFACQQAVALLGWDRAELPAAASTTASG